MVIFFAVKKSTRWFLSAALCGSVGELSYSNDAAEPHTDNQAVSRQAQPAPILRRRRRLLLDLPHHRLKTTRQSTSDRSSAVLWVDLLVLYLFSFSRPSSSAGVVNARHSFTTNMNRTPTIL